jgi:phage regulator Rha-like protein
MDTDTSKLDTSKLRKIRALTPPAPSLFDHAPGNALTSVTGSEPTMTSQEIADLVKSRHDNVKRTIENLVDRGTITLPQTEETPTPGGGKPKMVYHLRQRESYIVVAQLSPEFTAELVDRWRELEAQVATPPEPAPAAVSLPDFTDPAEAAMAWAAEYKKREAAENDRAIAENRAISMTKDSEALNRFSNADGSLTVTDVAKMLKVLPGYLFDLMPKERWIYRRGRSGNWQAYQDKQQAGYLRHVGRDIPWPEVSTNVSGQVRVTPKLAKLSTQEKRRRSASPQPDMRAIKPE